MIQIASNDTGDPSSTKMSLQSNGPVILTVDSQYGFSRWPLSFQYSKKNALAAGSISIAKTEEASRIFELSLLLCRVRYRYPVHCLVRSRGVKYMFK